jgi:CUG-BP- and ETR3-like factor
VANEEDVQALFERFGAVEDVSLFRAFRGAPTTRVSAKGGPLNGVKEARMDLRDAAREKQEQPYILLPGPDPTHAHSLFLLQGCGLVIMGTHQQALAAIEALDSQHIWPGMEARMAVKWMDTKLQRQRREQHLAAMHRNAAAATAGADPTSRMSLPGGPLGSGRSPLMLPEPDGGGCTPPVGCDPDAIKLFVGNIPKCYTEEQLLPYFETISPVVELVVVMDKVTRRSKGSAFVWYPTRQIAERAILQLNLSHSLVDPTGEQDRPLVVRRAKSRPAPVVIQRAPSAAAGPGLAGMLPLMPLALRAGVPDLGAGSSAAAPLGFQMTPAHIQQMQMLLQMQMAEGMAGGATQQEAAAGLSRDLAAMALGGPSIPSIGGSRQQQQQQQQQAPQHPAYEPYVGALGERRLSYAKYL